ncbi:MAG TPA: SoxR reducing system RseC family protein [Spirochaetota bacterium]|nr:SoxR reducing system RseC family protein [Spirochaetota bacterium]HPJ16451.1 SoxR reducing system RseC family protein [Spirochaetota bacterium]HQO23163.1 SoxR reducing system RseC family protein [Spirochaetota bacterium]HQQ23027.1 SoxR reducing system RseC family protein [Spirochaetota bacterium]
MTEKGVVISVENGTALVEPALSGGDCHSCPSKMFCSAKSGKRIIRMKAIAGLKKGDEVEFENDSSVLIKFAVFAFFIPTVVLIVSLFAASRLLPDSFLSPLISGILCFASFLLIKIVFKSKVYAARISDSRSDTAKD